MNRGEQSRPRLAGKNPGLGLTEIGRPWGASPSPVPDEARAHEVLAAAVEAGVRIFDTAPSYGPSEPRLGRFLARLPAEVRGSLFVSTKTGESWDEASGRVSVDHGYEALVTSMERSLDLLGAVDLIQIHRPCPDVLRHPEVRRALDHARSLGIPSVGASVSDLESARVAIEELGVDVLQIPYHLGNDYMADAFGMARASGCSVLINRSLAMGALIGPEADPVGPDADPGDSSDRQIREAFAFILRQDFDGGVLFGTTSVSHLLQNLSSFHSALEGDA